MINLSRLKLELHLKSHDLVSYKREREKFFISVNLTVFEFSFGASTNKFIFYLKI